MITSQTSTLRIPGQFDSDKLSAESDLSCLDPTLAQAHMASGLDINELVNQFMLDPAANPPFMLPGADLTGLPTSLHDAYNTMQTAYDSLPSHLRQQFVDWRDMAHSIATNPGLLVDKPVSDPQPASTPVVVSAPSGAAAQPQDGGKAPV